MRTTKGSIAAWACAWAWACALGCVTGCSGGGGGGSAPPPVVVEVAPGSPSASASVSAGLDPSAPASRNPSVAPGDGAGEAPSGTSKDIVEARRLFQEGKAFFDRGDYPQALDRFVAAQHFAPQPAMLYDIGRTLELMGRNGEAADVYEHYLQTDLSHMDRMSMELRIKQLRSAGP